MCKIKVMQNQELSGQQPNIRPPRRSRRNNLIAGLLLLVIGVVLMTRQVERHLIPDWLFTWPMILIIVGLFVGIQTRFRDFAWLILLGIGTFFLADDVFPNSDAGRFVIPTVVCLAGLLLVLSPGRKKQRDGINYPTPTYEAEPADNAARFAGDSLDATAIFGNVKKVIYSKNFRGGEVVAIFGGAEINLIQADMQGPIVLEVVQIFGGTKLIVPPHWEVRSEAVAIFGGIEDKRPPQTITSPDKVIILQGTALFAGIEIKSF